MSEWKLRKKIKRLQKITKSQHLRILSLEKAWDHQFGPKVTLITPCLPGLSASGTNGGSGGSVK